MLLISVKTSLDLQKKKKDFAQIKLNSFNFVIYFFELKTKSNLYLLFVSNLVGYIHLVTF